MPKLRSVSGAECIKILCNKFSFTIIRRKGSHVLLRKYTLNGQIATVVPDHDHLKIGTLKGVLKLAQVDEKEFSKYL
jgi:predicted RNA binding protein YcfA (HicA-like mRNA interferase family)